MEVNIIDENGHLTEDQFHLLEMTVIDDFQYGGQTYQIDIKSREVNNISYIHIRTLDNKPYSCVRLDKAEYFLHGSYQHVPNHHEVREFSKAMNRKPKSRKLQQVYANNWERCVDEWNTAHEGHEIDDTVMPDYRNLADWM